MSHVEALEGKVAWITGSSRGIGRSVAHVLAEAGARVAVHGTHTLSPTAFGEGKSMDELVSEIAPDAGGMARVDVIAVTGDLADKSMVHQAAEIIRQRLGPIDILVNCAGGDIGAGGVSGPNCGKPADNNPVDISLEDMRSLLDRNLMTCILCCQEIAPEMRARRRGVIVNMGSVAGMIGQSHQAIYSTAKAAVHHYTRCLADHLRPFGVRANAVAPGEITSARFLASRPIDETRVKDRVSLTRYGVVEDVANTVLFLVSDASSYVSGQVVRIDGAQQCWPG